VQRRPAVRAPAQKNNCFLKVYRYTDESVEMKAAAENGTKPGRNGTRVSLLIAGFTLASIFPVLSVSKNAEPNSAREFYNEGARYLSQTNLWRAEYNLERALSFQDERFQPPALYNLGLIRFDQGAQELKKGPGTKRTAATSDAVVNEADEAMRAMDQAMAGSPGSNVTPGTNQPAQAPPPGDVTQDDAIPRLVASYLQGRGARRDLNSAMKAVKAALQAHGATLLKWQRSSGDFKSTVELKETDADARHNAEVVDRCIAKLVDEIKKLQQMQEMLGKKQQQLGDKMKKCKGQIPAPNMPPGAAGDEDEDERLPSGKEEGKDEAGKRDQEEKVGMTAEQAAWLLESFKLDSERRLPMTEASRAQQPRDRSKPTW